jgi:hypothetical protein
MKQHRDLEEEMYRNVREKGSQEDFNRISRKMQLLVKKIWIERDKLLNI